MGTTTNQATIRKIICTAIMITTFASAKNSTVSHTYSYCPDASAIASYEVHELPTVVTAQSDCVFDVNDVDWQPGTNIQLNSLTRGKLANLFNNDEKNFLSLGQGGKVTIYAPTTAGVVHPESTCQIADKILAFDEITWCNLGYTQYKEVGKALVELEQCDDHSHNTLKANDAFSVTTGEQVRLEFPSPEYAGCHLKSIIIEDDTPPGTGWGDGSDGLDISNVRVLPMTPLEYISP